MARRVSFYARTKIKRRVKFKSGGKTISFWAKTPSKRRKRVSFWR